MATKTSRAASKRFKVRGSGSIVFKGPLRQHKMSNRSPKRMMNLKASRNVHDSDLHTVQLMLGIRK